MRSDLSPRVEVGTKTVSGRDNDIEHHFFKKRWIFSTSAMLHLHFVSYKINFEGQSELTNFIFPVTNI